MTAATAEAPKTTAAAPAPSPLVVALLTPVYPAPAYQCALTRECLIGGWRRWAEPHWRLRPEMVRQQPVTVARNILAQRVLERRDAEDLPPADVLVWMDADVGLDDPREIVRLVHLLVGAPDDVAMIGVPVAVQAESVDVAKGKIPWNVSSYGIPGGAARVSELFAVGEDLVEVAGVGFGLVACRATAYASMTKPYHQWDQNSDLALARTEDMLWCDEARRLGYRIMVTPRIRTARHYYTTANGMDTDVVSFVMRHREEA